MPHPKRSAGAGKLERRTIKTEVRAKATDDGARHIEGYASMFNQPYTLTDCWWGGEFVEIVDPHAFDRCLAENPDVRCLFNHDPNWILGRTKSKTLTIAADSKGLSYDCTAAAGPMAAHVSDSIERGDVDGSSFGFMVLKDQWVDETDENGRTIKSTRTILDAEIYDVSPVVYPANPGTSASIRSLFPAGMPAEFRSRMEKRNSHCECTCQECEGGNCRECSDPDCTDPNCEAEKDEQNDRSKKPGHKHQRSGGKCECACEQCKGANCEECSMEDCSDENCRCNMSRSLTPKLRQAVRSLVDSILDSIEGRGDAKTKKVDGVDLTSDCFAYVGDPDKTSTWKLPIKFPGDEDKTKSHIRNALARFEQTKGIPEDEKPKVLAKIKAAAKAHDIEVSEENSAKPEDVEQRKRRLRQIELALK